MHTNSGVLVMDEKACGERRMGMNEVLTAQKVMTSSIESMEEKVEWLEEAIRGNGKPGINERLALIEARLQSIDRTASLMVKVLMPLLTSVLLLGLGAWVKSVT